MLNIPVITYHRVSNDKEFGLNTLPVHKFKEQIRFLKEQGYTTLTFIDLLNLSFLPEKPIIITFDDGYEDAYTNVADILIKYGMKAVVFIITGYIGKYSTWEYARFQTRRKHLNTDQIYELSKNNVEIGSHGHSHRYLSALNQKTVQTELTFSKHKLEMISNQKVITFSYPFGRTGKNVIQTVKDCGYHYATVNISSVNKNKSNLLCIPRRTIYRSDTLKQFISKIENQSLLSRATISEMIIQKGALISIGLSFLHRKKISIFT